MRLKNRVRRLPLHAQVAQVLRQEIAKCAVGQKLDPEDKLAERLGVSVLTLRHALAGLAQEGLIDRRHGSGTYATGRQQPQQVVAIGTATDPGRPAGSFQLRLFLLLSDLFIRHGYQCRAYAVPHGVLSGWSELAAEVARGRVAGAVFVDLNPDLLPIAFAKHGVPCIGPGHLPTVDIGLDYERLVRDGVNHLLQLGCRRLAMMEWHQPSHVAPPTPSKADIFRSMLAEQGVTVREEWLRSAVPPTVAGAGWEQFREIWVAHDEQPDGLLVTDDVLCRDVALGILDSGIKVPEQLQVVTHANKDSGLTYPFPVSQLEVDVREWAELTVSVLIRLMNHEPATGPVPLLRARLIPAETSAAGPRVAGAVSRNILSTESL